jgi:hypothetical protein
MAAYPIFCSQSCQVALEPASPFTKRDCRRRLEKTKENVIDLMDGEEVEGWGQETLTPGGGMAAARKT